MLICLLPGSMNPVFYQREADHLIKLSNVWLDHDGNALPLDLPGYTARGLLWTEIPRSE